MNKNQEIALKQQVMLLTNEKRYVEAKAAALKLAKALPKDVEVWFALAQLQAVLGEFKAAVESFYKACQAPSPIFPVAVEKAVGLCAKHQLDKLGIAPAQELVKLKPKSALAHFYLGFFWFNLKHYLTAESSLLKAVELEPENVMYLNHCGQLYAYIGQAEKGLRFFERSQKLNPKDKLAFYFSLLCYDYVDQVAESEVFAAHRNFGALLEQQYPELEPFPTESLQTTRKLKVGYISQDFKAHSVAYFFQAIIDLHARERYEIYCYSDVDYPDAVTEQIKTQADHWCDCRLLSDEQLYQQIRTDGIDLLVDLVGYAGVSRVEVFARKAAPVQITYLGYPNTTGLSRMDYRLTDAWSDPEGLTERWYSETLARLPGGFLCFTPAADAPELAELPASKKAQGICFGSCNAFQKLAPRMFKLWASILAKVAHSRLYIKARPLHEERLREQVWQTFEALGIARDRVELVGWTEDQRSHLAHYDKIDIHLDSYPYNGTTTLCEALWQGVPSITLAGDTHRSRVGLSILTQVGLADFVATDDQQYLDIAVSKAADLTALAELRRSMRERMSASTLMDRTRFIAELEACYEQFYCDRFADSSLGEV